MNSEIIVPKLGSFNVPLQLSPLQIDPSALPHGAVTGEWFTLETGSSMCGTKGAFGLWCFLTTINRFGGTYPGSAGSIHDIIPRQFWHWYLDETGIFSVSHLLSNPQQYGNYSFLGYRGNETHGPGTIHFSAFDNGIIEFITGQENLANAFCDIILLKNKVIPLVNTSALRISHNLDTGFSGVPSLILIDWRGAPQFLFTNINSKEFNPSVYGWKPISLEIPFPRGEYGTNGLYVFPIIRIGPAAASFATYYPLIDGPLFGLESFVADPYSANVMVTTDVNFNWRATNLRIPWGDKGGLGSPAPALSIHLSNSIDDDDFNSSYNGGHFAIPGGGFGIHSKNNNAIYLIDSLFRGYYKYNIQPSDGNASYAFAYGAGMDWHGNIWCVNQHWDAATLYSSIGTHQTSPLKLFGEGALNFNSQVAFSECIPDLQRRRLW